MRIIGKVIGVEDLSYDELLQVMQEIGEPSYRARQIFSFVARGIQCYRDITNIPISLGDKLNDRYSIVTPRIHERYESADATVKYSLKLMDGGVIEAVVMRYKHGLSVCVSTQAGCRMGCRFCASAIGGKTRDLSSGEILGTVAIVQKDIGARISNITLMGIGEPLDNYDNIIKFIHNASNEKGLNISCRSISLSTCGLVDKIYALAEEGLPVTLSLSLHAADDDTRGKIMPISKKYKIKDILAACDNYFDKTGRRVSYEYILLNGVNDGDNDAYKLARLLKGKVAHVNIIPANPIPESGFTASRNSGRFVKLLCERGINATLRRTLGGDISAACGQLRCATTNLPNANA